MKVHKPGTDCEVEFSILANGRACQEYVLPDADDEPNAGICFIPVPEDANITIQGFFSGSVLYGRVDVLADGAFVADRIIEDAASKEGILKYWDNRKVEIKTFLHVPDMHDHKPRLRPKVVEGGLVTKRLSNAEIAGPLHGGDDSTAIGVGSITLVVSLNQDVFDTYGVESEPAYPSVSLGSWRNTIHDVADSGIPPELEMRMDVFPDSNPVKDKRATLFWRDHKAARFGSEAWAYLVFYYRTQAAVDAAGCVPLSQAKALPADGGLFIRASEQELLATERVNKSKSSSPAPVPVPAPETKRSMGLGQALLLPSNQRAKEPNSLRKVSNESERDSVYESADDMMPNRDNDKTTSDTANSSHAPAMRHSLLSSKRDESVPALHSPTPHVSFSDPLTIGPSKDLGRLNNNVRDSPGGSHVDDLASPSLSAFESRYATSKPTIATNKSPTVEPPTKPSDPVKSAHHPPPHKRPASHLDTNPSGPASSSATASPSHTPAKRIRSEQSQQEMAQLRANLQAMRERKAAMQKRIDDEKSAQQEQQQRWEEENARRLKEEARRKAAEEEEEARREEAFAAEMEALRREVEMESEDVARVAEEGEKQRREWEDLVRARGQDGEFDV